MANWCSLPTEMQLAVLGQLSLTETRALAYCSRSSYTLTIPTLFANVHLSSFHVLKRFVDNVPVTYGQYIQTLSVNTRVDHSISQNAETHPRTDALIALLDRCPRLSKLTLALDGSLAPHALPAFTRLSCLTALDVEPARREEDAPVSERFVVALARSVPALEHLSLSRITRSAALAHPCSVPLGVPLTEDGDTCYTFDGTVPFENLYLPTLLDLRLRTLRICDTYLGCDAVLPYPSVDFREGKTGTLEQLTLTGSMYVDPSTDDTEPLACAAWLAHVPNSTLSRVDLGCALATPRLLTSPGWVSPVDSPVIPFTPVSPSSTGSAFVFPPVASSRARSGSLAAAREAEVEKEKERLRQQYPAIEHLHLNASRFFPEATALATTLQAVPRVDKLSVADDDFPQEDPQCAMDDLADWCSVLADILPGSGVQHVDMRFGSTGWNWEA